MQIEQVMKELKPIWKNRQDGHYGFYCPNCRAERRVHTHPSPLRPMNFLRIGLLTSVFSVACWSWFSWKGLVSFVPFWVAFEVIFRSRMRIELLCPYCGFDPFLYLTDVKQARAGVEAHWRKVFREKGIPFPGEALSDVPEATTPASPASSPSTSPPVTPATL